MTRLHSSSNQCSAPLRARWAAALAAVVVIATQVQTMSASADTNAPVPSGSWSAGSPMAVGRSDQVAVRLVGGACTTDPTGPLCGDVMVVGGNATGFLPTPAVEVYDVASASWSVAASV